MTLYIKDKNYFDETVFQKILYNEKVSQNDKGLFVDKGSGSGIFPDPNPDPGDPKRPDPQNCSLRFIVVHGKDCSVQQLYGQRYIMYTEQ